MSLRAEVISYKEDNESLVRAQEKKYEINAIILQSLYDLQRQRKYEMRASQRDRKSLHES